MRRITTAERRSRSVVLHTALVGGSIAFSIPFIWLISTSCKVPDEMYPPKWLPQIPRGVIESPYVALRENERLEKPTPVRAEDWIRTRVPIQHAIGEQVISLAEELPAFYGPYLGTPELVEGIFNRLVKRAPDVLFTQGHHVVADWFALRVNDALIKETFERVYRRVAVSDVVLHGWDVVTVESPTAGQRFQWQVVSGEATLVPRYDGLLRPCVEVHYSFAKSRSFMLQTTLPMSMEPARLKKVSVGLHSDRSWHEVRASVELAGRRYEAVQPAFLSSDRWQDTTWQFASEEDRSLKIKTWLRLEDKGPSEFSEPNAIRIRLTFQYHPRWLAVIHKFLFNYRDCLRMVPLIAYIKNSVLLVALNVVGQVLASSLVAYAFARLRWPGRDFCFVLVLATLMIPAQVTMVPVFLIYKSLGWYNTLRPLWITAFTGSAFFIFLLRQFMTTIPTELEDSAKIDGCGYLGMYARIILPLIKPALATIGIFTFMGVWNDFMSPLIYLSDQELYPLSLGLFALKVFQGTNFGLMMAASVLMTLPVILLFFLAQRQFIQGITLTGLKG